VHRARLADGSAVAVKVRRPSIRPVIEADLRWLMRLAESENPELRNFRPQEVVRQFEQSLQRELDFASECRNAERIAANFAAYADQDAPPGARPVIVIPQVYWQLTGERVCVQEYIDGIPGRELVAADRAGLDRKLLARRGANAVLKVIVEDGYFHTNPHPGNVFYLPGNRIAFIDFSMVGRLTEQRRDQLIRLMLGMVQHEPERVADVMLDWTRDGDAGEAGILLEIQAFVDLYHDVPLKQLSLGAMINDLVSILRDHHIALPADLALLIKAFITLEGMGRELDPDFDMAGTAMPILERALRALYPVRAVQARLEVGRRDARAGRRPAPRPVAAAARGAARAAGDPHRRHAPEARRQPARPRRQPAGGRHRRRRADHRLVDRDDRTRRPQAAGTAAVRPGRLSRRRRRRRMAAAVDLAQRQGGPRVSAIVGAGHARDCRFVRGQHPQGVRRGCKGLKPQQHTQGPLLQGVASCQLANPVTPLCARAAYQCRMGSTW
jgi:hypothetical protein